MLPSVSFLDPNLLTKVAVVDGSSFIGYSNVIKAHLCINPELSVSSPKGYCWSVCPGRGVPSEKTSLVAVFALKEHYTRKVGPVVTGSTCDSVLIHPRGNRRVQCVKVTMTYPLISRTLRLKRYAYVSLCYVFISTKKITTYKCKLIVTIKNLYIHVRLMISDNNDKTLNKLGNTNILLMLPGCSSSLPMTTGLNVVQQDSQFQKMLRIESNFY